jgi:hypothetical protein
LEICKGFGDWFACVKCPDICTKRCPIERENAIEELRQGIKMIEGSDEVEIKNLSNIYSGETSV